MQLASRFRNASGIRADMPLSDDQIRNVAPSIFAEAAHESRSARYTYIPTIDVLNGLRKEGFQPFMVCQTRVRNEEKREHTKHMIRLRHNGDVVGEVIEGAFKVLDSFEEATAQREAMQVFTLNQGEQAAFARAALALKYDDQDSGAVPVTESQILAPRRFEDRRDDMWTTFNRVQENMMKGGLRGRNRSGRTTTTRPVNGIDEVLADPAASHWMKDALRSALARDPVDVANDAAFLCALLDKRADAAMEAGRAAVEKVMRNGLISAPADASAFFSLRLGNLEHEVFAAIFLDAQNRVIEYIELFRGTLTQTSVYPREVVKTSLRLNAAAVIFAHNHPSGVPEPSRADENLTRVLKDALALVDVRVLDHVVVAGGASVSFAQRGLL